MILNASNQADFGVVLPMYSLLATIAFAYSVISPLINALALLSQYSYQFEVGSS
jgi:hypothetical protein